ncbi:MAG TPA: hypothetical protein VMW27_06085 [Thermoanaerobaculia bacterium]|nr:hypothetical protein [Thermoanaerobaculia bacterium]
MAYLRGGCEVRIVRDGVLPLPEVVLGCHGLQEGDLLALDVVTFRQAVEHFQKFQIRRSEAARLASLPIRIYSKLLATRYGFPTSEGFWPHLARFLSLPLTVIGAGGSLTIPPDVLALRQGERVRLRYAGEHSLSLGRD